MYLTFQCQCNKPQKPQTTQDNHSRTTQGALHNLLFLNQIRGRFYFLEESLNFPLDTASLYVYSPAYLGLSDNERIRRQRYIDLVVDEGRPKKTKK